MLGLKPLEVNATFRCCYDQQQQGTVVFNVDKSAPSPQPTSFASFNAFSNNNNKLHAKFNAFKCSLHFFFLPPVDKMSVSM